MNLLPLCSLLLACTTVGQAASDPLVWSTDRLAQQTYDGGPLLAQRVLSRSSGFTRSLIRFDSGGLNEYGFANVPDGPGPFPVIVMVHGYTSAATYRTTTYTTRYADDLARHGFLVLHPDLRGHGRSQGQADPPFLAAYAVDVLNLIGSVRGHAGQGVLAKARPGPVGLWGHSDGGNVVLRSLEIKPDWVKAAVLYSSISADERQNARQDVISYGGEPVQARRILSLPATVLDAVSPVTALSRITASLSIYSGQADREGPPVWAAELCRRLGTLGKVRECFSSPGAPHLFPAGTTWNTQFLARTTAFFKRELK